MFRFMTKYFADIWRELLIYRAGECHPKESWVGAIGQMIKIWVGGTKTGYAVELKDLNVNNGTRNQFYHKLEIWVLLRLICSYDDIQIFLKIDQSN